MTQAKNGDMWFGTHGGGITIFNGIDSYYITTKDGLPNYKIWDLFTASDGVIWIGTTNNIAYYDGFEIKVIPQEVDDVRNITEDAEGNIWFSTDTALYKIDNFKIIEVDANIYISPSVFCDSKNNIWFFSADGISKISNGKISIEYKEEFLSGNAIYEDDQQNIWFATNNGLYQFNQIEFLHYDVNSGLASNSINDVLQDNDGMIWLATEDNGINLFNGFKFNHLSTENGLGIEYIHCLYKDFHGNVWIGSDGDGAYMLKDYRFIQYKFDDIADNGFIMTIKRDKDGNFWIGTDGSGVITNKNGTFETFDTKNGLVSDYVFDIEQDNNGNIWFATYEGYSVYNGTTFKNYSATLGNFECDFMMSLLADSKDNVWLGTNGYGVYKFYPDGSYDNYNNSNSFDATTVWDILEASDGKIYFATSNGLVVFSETDTINYTEKDGLNELGLGTVMEEKETGLIWIGSDRGISRFDGENFINYTRDDGLSSDICYLVYKDSTGHFISGNERGIDKIKFSDDGEILSIKHFGSNDGFFGIECNLNAITEDEDGILYIGTVDWVTAYNPFITGNSKYEALTKITNIKLFYENIDWKQYADSLMPWNKLPYELVLPYNKNNLTFEFVGVDFQNPEDIKYQFMLEGFDNEWMPLTSANYATYTNIPPGEYKFKIKALASNGTLNTNPAEFSFVIKKPFWQTYLFYIVTAIFLIVTIRILIGLRTKRLKLAKIELQNKVKERTAEIMQQKEEIEAHRDEISIRKEIAESHRDEILKQQKKITASIVYAKRIQKALFPQDDIFKENFTDYFIYFKPRDIVSGDFYWIKQIDEHVLFAVADCTGHGVPGAFMSLLGISYLNEIVVRSEITQTKQVLEVLRTRIKNVLHQSDQDSDSQDGMDIAVCCYNKKDMTLLFSGANIPAYIVKNHSDNFEILRPDRQPIGVYIKEDSFTQTKIDIQKGDKIYMFSDGIIDQLGGENHQKFMRKNFNEVIINASKNPMIEQKNTIEYSFEKWKGDIGQLDDVLVVGIEI